MADTDNQDGQGGGGRGSIVGLLLATALAAGGGGFLGWTQFGKAPEAGTHAAKPAHGGHGEDKKFTEGSRVRDLVPITTNLAGQPAAWIRLEASVLLAPETEPSEEVDVMLRTIGEDVIAYLRTVSLQQIQGPSGFQSVRDDLDERVRIRSEGKAQELIVQAMILE